MWNLQHIRHYKLLKDLSSSRCGISNTPTRSHRDCSTRTWNYIV